MKTVKPILSNKLTHKEKINLSENRENRKTHMELAKVWKTFFSNFVQNLNIFRFLDSDPLIRNIKDPTLKAILKFSKHPSIITVESKYRYFFSFSFVEVNAAKTEKEILNLNWNKASQNSDMLTKVIKKKKKKKKKSDIFNTFLCTSFNTSIKTPKFL